MLVVIVVALGLAAAVHQLMLVQVVVLRVVVVAHQVVVVVMVAIRPTIRLGLDVDDVVVLRGGGLSAAAHLVRCGGGGGGGGAGVGHGGWCLMAPSQDAGRARLLSFAVVQMRG